MLEILARSLMIAAHSQVDRDTELTEWDRARNLDALDQPCWWGRRWRHPEQHGE